MNNSRTKKSIRNIAYGFFNQFVMLIIGFISRMIFLKYLNESYLGINSLFTEILSMLSLADLGLSTVMAVSYTHLQSERDQLLVLAL